jgi:deoxyribodipyrimidine photo-lyase
MSEARGLLWFRNDLRLADNPVLQAQKFDPKGEYIARWVPELAGLPAAQRHAPWTGVIPSGYPRPMLDLAKGRADALAALAGIRVAR